MSVHSKQTGKSAVHPIAYKSSTDPATDYGTDATAAQKTWFDTTNGTHLGNGWLWKIRNAANNGWDTLLDLATALALKANLASPTFTGTPVAPTATGGTNTTQIATTAFVTAAVSTGGVVSSVFGRTGAVVKTSGDYAVADVTGAAPLASPTFTGTPAAPTASAATSTTQIATTAFATTADNLKANLASPTFTGTVTIPTATAGDNSTKAASTAYADNAVAKQPETLMLAVSDESTAITTGTGKLTFRMPFACSMTALPRASLNTVSSSGNPAVNIKKNGTTIFSTTLTIDATEKTSVTAATPAVLSGGSTTFADDDEITIDIDTAGTGAKGLKVTLNVVRT